MALPAPALLPWLLLPLWPLLLLPLLVPVLLGAVGATAGLLETGTLRWRPVQLLLVTDAVFGIVSFLGFEYVLDE